MRVIGAVALLVWLGGRICAEASGVPAQQPVTSARDVAVVAGKVERLDPFARTVTLRTPEGLQHTVYAGKELKAFDQLRSGESVTVRISESVVVAVRPNAKMTALEERFSLCVDNILGEHPAGNGLGNRGVDTRKVSL